MTGPPARSPSDRPLAARMLGSDDWRAWRAMRLQALQESPAAFGSTYAHEQHQPESFWRQRLGDPGSVSVLAGSGSRPVGMGCGVPDLPGLLHVVAMWVDPAARRQGVAHAVLDVLRDRAAARDLLLQLDVETTNAAARRCYEAYGFVATGETRPIRKGSADVVERMVLG